MKITLLIITLASFMVSSCAIPVAMVRSVAPSKVRDSKNQLQSGMTTQQVKALLGEPKSTSGVTDHLQWKYSYYNKGGINRGLYLSFKKNKLIKWF